MNPTYTLAVTGGLLFVAVLVVLYVLVKRATVRALMKSHRPKK